MTALTSVEDYSRDTLFALVRRLQVSDSWEDLLYREVELDEVWRLIDADRFAAAQRAGGAVHSDTLKALQKAVHDVHDMVAEADDGSVAARRLTEIILASGQVLDRGSARTAD